MREIDKLDFTKTMDFEVVGDIKPTIIEILGYYETEMWGDCTLHLKGTHLELPAFWRYLTYRGWNTMKNGIERKIIQKLWDRKLIKLHEVSDE